ncbi:MAG: type IV secretory system conjugative DNA transfer family protein [Candidatus Obscuribacterales bacterium]|nr:type IV secretory system conjugative DNA transfer family protein [Candidatus Obscuribacterales bacterium]
MPASSKDSFAAEVPTDKVSRIFLSTLRRLQWKPTFVDPHLNLITAEKRYSERIRGIDWRFEFTAVINWRESEGDRNVSESIGVDRRVCRADRAAVEIEVLENKYPWTQSECAKHVRELAASCLSGTKQLHNLTVAETRGARWATQRELHLAGYLGEARAGTLLITSDKSNAVSLRIPDIQTNRHALICGPTGSGKTTGVFIPNLLERTESSAIVTEATGGKGIADLFRKTHAYRASKGHDIYFFNPDDLSSDRINPLDFVNTEADATRITELIMQSTTLSTHRGDQSWEMSERLLLSSLILHSVGEREQGNCSMSAVAKMAMKGAKHLQELLLNSDIEEATDIYQSFHENTSEGYRNLVITGLVNRIKRWREPRIRALTEKTDIDFATLPEKLFTLYFAVPAEKDELKQVAAVMFNVVLNFVLGHEFKHPIFLSLDEFTNFGYVARMPQKLTILRHDKLPVLLGVQDFQQLKLVYKDEANLLISQPATKIFFKPNEYDTAKKVSEMVGVTIEEASAKVTSSGQLRETREKEPLLSPDELMTLGAIDEKRGIVESGKPHMVVFLPETRPVKVSALTWRDYLRHTDTRSYPMLARRVLQVDENLTRRSSKPKDTAPPEPEKRATFDLGRDRTPEEMEVGEGEEPDTEMPDGIDDQNNSKGGKDQDDKGLDFLGW